MDGWMGTRLDDGMIRRVDSRKLTHIAWGQQDPSAHFKRTGHDRANVPVGQGSGQYNFCLSKYTNTPDLAR